MRDTNGKQTSASTYALCIGVNDYRQADESMGRARGTSDCLGAIIDAKTWWQASRDGRIPTEHIDVYTAPFRSAAAFDFPEDMRILGLATRDAILAAFEAMCVKVAQEPFAFGAFCFAGNGGVGPDGTAVICPTDTVGPDLTGAIALSELAAIMEKHGLVSERIGFYLDCAFTRPRDMPSAYRVRSLGPVSSSMLDGSGGVVCAGSPMGAGVERLIRGEWRGIFTRNTARFMNSIDLDWEFHAGDNGFTVNDPQGNLIGHLVVPSNDIGATLLSGNEYWLWTQGPAFPAVFTVVERQGPLPPEVQGAQGFEVFDHQTFDVANPVPYVRVDRVPGDRYYAVEFQDAQGQWTLAAYLWRKPVAQGHEHHWYGASQGLHSSDQGVTLDPAKPTRFRNLAPQPGGAEQPAAGTLFAPLFA